MYKHYIRVNGDIVIYGFSSEFELPLDTDICINENGGRQFELLGEVNPQLVNDNGTHRFRCVKVVKQEKVPIIEDVTDEVVVDTSGVELDEGATLTNVDVSATATGYKFVEHDNVSVRYATKHELEEELASLPEQEYQPTDIEILKKEVEELKEQNVVLTECLLEMSEVVYGG